MLRTAFFGNDNAFDRMICAWLAERTELLLVVWTNRMAWAGGGRVARRKKIVRRFSRRARRLGVLRVLNEILYYVAYRAFIQRSETIRILREIERVETDRGRLHSIPQIVPESLRNDELLATLRALDLDALFAMCIDVVIPGPVLEIPRRGAFLWHEGITPEYRGVYSPFWALYNGDFDSLGYTFLKMTDVLDGGEIYLQGRTSSVDPWRDWHSFIGHKAIIESLARVEPFLEELERGTVSVTQRPGAIDGYYSYPTFTALCRIIARRMLHRRGLGHPTSRRDETRN